MKSFATLFLAMQDWWVNWFGETSAVQWIGLFIALLFAAGAGLTVYLSMLRGHLSANRNPSALRSLCAALFAAIAFGLFTMIFYGAFVYYITAALFAVFGIVAGVFYLGAKKAVTKS